VSDLRALVALDRYCEQSRLKSLLATVVRTQGSVYPRAGARLLITEDGQTAGRIGAAFLERDLVRGAAEERLQQEDSALVRYDSVAEEDTSGCSGRVEILLERAETPGARAMLDCLRSCVEHEQSARVATVFASGLIRLPRGTRAISSVLRGSPAAAADSEADALLELAALGSGASRAQCHEFPTGEGCLEVLVESVEPPPCLFIVGSGPDTVPIASLALELGWKVVVVAPDTSPEALRRLGPVHHRVLDRIDGLGEVVDSHARPLAVVMSHLYECDLAALDELCRSRAKYIGMLGPRRRTESMMFELGTDIVRRAVESGRVHSPLELDLGAQSAAEIALSAVAEMQRQLTGSTGERLSDRAGPLDVVGRFRHPHDAAAE
jgi:xanthine/CO dehydrogenase XdhC/CoxF family maturation factor